MSWLVMLRVAGIAGAALTTTDAWATTLDNQSRAEKAQQQSSRDATRAEIMRNWNAGTSTQFAAGGETTGHAGSNNDQGSSSENESAGNSGHSSGSNNDQGSTSKNGSTENSGQNSHNGQ